MKQHHLKFSDMKNYRSYPLAILLTILLLCQGYDTASANTLRTFKKGDKLPGFSLSLLDENRTYSFTPGATGKPAALMFFAINPTFRKVRALALLSELEQLAAMYIKNVDFISVYCDDREKQTVTDYMKYKNLHMPVLADPQRAIYNKYGVFMMPLVLIIGRDGSLHEIIPYTFNIRELVEGNLKLLLGKWSEEEFQESLNPKEIAQKSEKEKEYIRRVNYGRIMVSRKMYSQAIREYNTAVKLMPDSAKAYIGLGFAFNAVKQWVKAEKVFKKALSLETDNDEAVAGLGLALHGKGETDNALNYLKIASTVPRPKLEVIIALAKIYERQGNLPKAVKYYNESVNRLLVLYEHNWR